MPFFCQIFLKCQYGFRKRFNPLESFPNCLVAMLEKKAKKQWYRKIMWSFPTNFLKGFGFLSHKIHIFIYHITFKSKTCSKWFQSYCFKVDVKWSSWEKAKLQSKCFSSVCQNIWCGVPQRSIGGPILFSIFLSDLNAELISYLGNNAPYSTGETPEEVISKLEREAKKLF